MNKSKPNILLSIIIPIYNSESYLEECLNSVINQYYKDLEIILVNDGSTDRSLEICNEFVKKDKRIFLISTINKGQAAARNIGLDHASGKYCAFIDSDDTISLDLFSENMAILESDSTIDVIQFPVYRNYGIAISSLKIAKQESIKNKELIIEKWLVKNTISWIVCDKIFKKEIFDTLRFKEDMVYEDNYMIADILSVINHFYVSEKGIYYYHSRQNSTTTSPHSLKKDLDTQKVSLHIYEELKKYPKLDVAKAIMQNRIINVAISLKKNFNLIPFNYLPRDLISKEIKTYAVLGSNLFVIQKIKMIIVKIIGLKLYFKYL